MRYSLKNSQTLPVDDGINYDTIRDDIGGQLDRIRAALDADRVS